MNAEKKPRRALHCLTTHEKLRETGPSFRAWGGVNYNRLRHPGS